MRVRFLYDQGTAPLPEDAVIFQPPRFYGVADGVSGLYLPNEKGPELFDGKTGGQLAVDVISAALREMSPLDSLEEILRYANVEIREAIKKKGLSFFQTELLPSASFVIASIGPAKITVLQAGDSLAVWQMKDGTTNATPNKMFRYERHLRNIIAQLMRKHNGDRQKVWEEFLPLLRTERRVNINTEAGRFAVLNGQPQAERFWQKFELSRKEIARLILFSDGFVPFKWTENRIDLAQQVIPLYRDGGLQLVLKVSRMLAGEKAHLSHEDYPEATAVAIEF